MSLRLRDIAEQTIAILERGAYPAPSGRTIHLSARIEHAVYGTRLYLPDEGLPDATGDVTTARITVHNESTLEATRRLAGAGRGVAALVFASARNPGGGFFRGAQAQEEGIARASALYPCQRAVPDFYAHHRASRDLRYSDRVIYSPDVPVFRDDSGRLLEDPYPVSFLTVAAPNTGAIRRNQPDLVGTVPATLRTRADRLLDVAAAHGHRHLVLGAWGCGVFGNDPAIVAEAFAAALASWRWFEEVHFAVLDHQPGTPTYTTFNTALRVS